MNTRKITITAERKIDNLLSENEAWNDITNTATDMWNKVKGAGGEFAKHGKELYHDLGKIPETLKDPAPTHVQGDIPGLKAGERPFTKIPLK